MNRKHKRNPFDGAWRKGRAAALAGKARTENPYPDHRKPSGLLSWSRAWRTAWFDGYDNRGPYPHLRAQTSTNTEQS